MKIFELFGGDNETVEEAANLLLRDCDPFLKEIDYKIGSAPLRGMHLEQSKFLKKYSVNKLRSPKDTPIKIHNFADQWFKEEFGIRFRSQSVFVVGDYFPANSHGTVFMIFPIGNFDYCYSNHYDDLTEEVTNHIERAIKQKRIKNLEGVNYEIVAEILEDGHYKKNIKLLDTIINKPTNEIMIHCDNYYAIPTDKYRGMFIDLVEFMKNKK